MDDGVWSEQVPTIVIVPSNLATVGSRGRTKTGSFWSRKRQKGICKEREKRNKHEPRIGLKCLNHSFSFPHVNAFDWWNVRSHFSGQGETSLYSKTVFLMLRNARLDWGGLCFQVRISRFWVLIPPSLPREKRHRILGLSHSRNVRQSLATCSSTYSSNFL